MNDNGTIREYDTNGNEIHYKDSNGYEYWKEYDADGNCMHYKDSSGVEYWYEYDANGNLIYYKNTTGYETWREYDANNNVIHYKNSDGFEEWYNSEGNVIDKPTKEGYNSTMSNTTTHYIVHYKFSNTYLRTPIGVCDRYNLVLSEAEATQFNDLDHAKRHIKIYSEMHLLCETYFEIFEVTVQRTCKQVITKEMALKCVGILSGAYSSQERIDAKTMLNTYIEQRN